MKPVIWTDFSEITVGEICNYLEKNFGLKTAEEYYFDVLSTVERIEFNPEVFPEHKNQSKVRKAVINKKTILYYKITEFNIVLLAFYDVRMNTHKF
jgi:plasmid stabilization system protein ParE